MSFRLEVCNLPSSPKYNTAAYRIAIRRTHVSDNGSSLLAFSRAYDIASLAAAQQAKCQVDRLLSATPSGHPQDGIVIRFDVEEFDPTLHQRLGIIRPDAIARSVLKRQAEFFYGRLATRLAMLSHGLKPLDVPIGRSREPVWPVGSTGSISHAAGIAGAVIASTAATRCKGIGLDIERIMDAESISAIRHHALNLEEASLLTDTFAGHIEAGMTVGFSAKESLYKAAFAEVGGFFDFDAARIVAVDSDLGIIELVIIRSLTEHIREGMRWRVRYIFLAEGLVVTHTAW